MDKIPTKHLCTLKCQRLYRTLYQFSEVVQKMHYIWIKFKKIYAGTARSKGAIWNEFSEQNQHQSIKKLSIFNTKLALFFY